MIVDCTEHHIEISMKDNDIDSGLISENLILYGSSIAILKWALSILTYTIIIL
jgi:hypothetical protein